jgi:transcriptional regulator with PAS, ATPase and Fis domain
MATGPQLESSGPSGEAPWTNPFIPAKELVGSSTAMSAVKDIAASIAARRCTVMIHGETGSGKEMLARHLHQLSDRNRNPFVPVDCSSLTDTLFESELFGHVRGAFTGAIRESLGFIRAADTGTLFMDEIGELSLPMQSKLLRVIQERIVVPVGSGKPHPVDVRIICATHRNLTDMVRDGTFREDLYFRLNVVVLQVPPLRERPADILPLARHFLAAQAALYDETPREIADSAAQLLVRYTWPGNVRELANVMEHAHVLSTDIIDEGNLPERLRAAASNPQKVGSDLLLQDIERRTIAEALRRTKFSKAAASRLLGINIQKLNRRIQRLGIRVPLL